MGDFRYDMQGKISQQQAVVRKRDKEDKIRGEQSKNKKVGKNPITSGKPIKTTKYCIIWKRAQIDLENDRVAAIELITVKELNREEIRFAYYKKNPEGNLRLITRPLDVTANELEKLLKLAREENIID